MAFDARVLDVALELVRADDAVRGRDAVHAATAIAHGIGLIASTDPAFGAVPGLTRLTPAQALAKLSWPVAFKLGPGAPRRAWPAWRAGHKTPRCRPTRRCQRGGGDCAACQNQEAGGTRRWPTPRRRRPDPCSQS
ncbi:MAG: PIN domain-containing protein, partial [Bifidobacteriaceae bacterium]|nr:PIN domain-containing protein [Bifidobacteriaceae bacterium]